MKELKVSVSGIRGVAGDSLTQEIVIKYINVFVKMCDKGAIIIGRDSRPSGEELSSSICTFLRGMGRIVHDMGLCPTPVVQMAVIGEKAAGGIIITASHNPVEWNGIKFVHRSGEFLDEDQMNYLQSFVSNEVNTEDEPKEDTIEVEREMTGMDHLRSILHLKLINVNAIRLKQFSVVIDCVNGAGSHYYPSLLEELDCDVTRVFCKPDGTFPRGPEPVDLNLGKLCEMVREKSADIGFAVDPDGDRLAIVDENGIPLGEEYSLVSAVYFMLQKRPGTIVTNLSTTRAIDDVAKQFNCKVLRTKIGESHVVKKLKAVNGVIGGEGNGGVILPDLHLGRNAAAGMILILQLLSEKGIRISELKKILPEYTLIKRILDTNQYSLKNIKYSISDSANSYQVNNDDGIKCIGNDWWLHVRPSNTEPIVRIFVEAPSKERAITLYDKFMFSLKRNEVFVP